MHMFVANLIKFFFWNRGNAGGNSGWASGGGAGAGGWNSYDSYGEHGAHSQPVAQQIAYSGHHKAARR